MSDNGPVNADLRAYVERERSKTCSACKSDIRQSYASLRSEVDRMRVENGELHDQYEDLSVLLYGEAEREHADVRGRLVGLVDSEVEARRQVEARKREEQKHP